MSKSTKGFSQTLQNISFLLAVDVKCVMFCFLFVSLSGFTLDRLWSEPQKCRWKVKMWIQIVLKNGFKSNSVNHMVHCILKYDWNYRLDKKNDLTTVIWVAVISYFHPCKWNMPSTSCRCVLLQIFCNLEDMLMRNPFSLQWM